MPKTTLKMMDRKTTISREKIRKAFTAVSNAIKHNGNYYNGTQKDMTGSNALREKQGNNDSPL